MSMSKPPVHKRPSLGPLEKPAPKRFSIDPNTWVLIKQIFVGVGIFLTLAIVVTTVWYTTRLTAFTITTVTAAGGETILPTEVVEVAIRELDGAYATIIPKRFSYLYPKEAMLKAASGVERIKNVEVSRISRFTVHITYDEYLPFALWCSQSATTTCLFIDERGFAFAPAPALSGGSFVRYRSTEKDPTLGDTILSFDDFWQTNSVVKLLETTGSYVRTVEVDSMRDAYYGLARGGELRASITQKPEEIVENVNTIFASKEFTHLRTGFFNYIDLRFGNKVYVNEQKLVVDTATGTAAASGTTSSNNATPVPAAAVVPDIDAPTLAPSPEIVTDSVVTIPL